MATTKRNPEFSPITEITVDEEPLLKPSEIAAASKSPARQPGLLEGVGSSMFSLARYFVAKAENLPRPLSSAVSVVEDVFGPQLSSSSSFVEHCTLDLLSYVDNQLDWIVAVVELGCIDVLALVLESKDAVMRAINQLVSGAGFMHYATDLLVSYEMVVKAQTSSILQVVLTTASKASPAPPVSKFEGQKTIDDGYEADLDLKPEKLTPKDDRRVNGNKSSSEKVVHEIAPAQDNHRSLPAIRKPLKTKSVQELDDDELSKLIDATWCLGSPRR